MIVSRATAAIAGATLAILAGGSEYAAAKNIDLTGVWRQEGAQAADKDAPVQVTLPNGDTSLHGTYVSLPYLEILRAKDGSLHLYSDVGALWAELVPVNQRPKVFDLKDLSPGGTGATLGRLHADSAECAPRPVCFQIVPESGSAASADDFPIPYGDTVFYLPVEPYDPTKDPEQKQTYGDNFAPLSANFGYVMRCYSIAPPRENGGVKTSTLDVVNPQKDTGCRNALFEEPTGESFSYHKTPLPDGANVDVPFGWSYTSNDVTTGFDKTQTIDTGRELSNSDSLDIGVNASVNLFGFEADASVSVATSNKLDTMMNTKSVVAKAQTVSTRYAFVLNRYYTKLNPDFVAAIRNLRNRDESDNAYKTVIYEWGTHYANAVTFGARGSRTATLDEKMISTLREKGTDIAAGLSAKYEGTGAKVDTKVANASLSDIENTVTAEDREFVCYGGGGCSEDGVPTGKDVVPIFLDLRPLSDLLAPPFFDGDEQIFGEVRRNLSQAITEAAYTTRNDLDQSTMDVVEAVNPSGTPLDAPQLLCGDQAVTRPPGAASPVTRDYCCAPLSAAVPVVATLSLKGVSDPVVRPAKRPPVNEPVSLPAGLTVDLPGQDDPAPFISGVTVDYGFYWQRDDQNQFGVYAPDINAFCQARFGDGWTGSMTAQSATCLSGSGSQTVQLEDVCQSQFQSPYHPVWSDAENAWYCSFEMTKPVDASAWCAAAHGAGSVAKSGLPIGFGMAPPMIEWSCEPGGNADPNAICGAMAGRTFKSTFFNQPDRDGNLQCTGMFVGVHTAEAADASIRSYPDLAPYDARKATAGTPVNVVVPLAWSGDAATTCNGVNLDLVIGLQTVPPETLIAGQ